MARAVRLYFENWKPEQAAECEAVKEAWEDLTDGGNLIFCMGVDNAQDDGYIREAWETAGNGSEEAQNGICLVTGKRSEISRIHKTIKCPGV